MYDVEKHILGRFWLLCLEISLEVLMLLTVTEGLLSFVVGC